MSLARRSAHAALWNYSGNGIRLLFQFSIGVLLARLLGPEAFGLVAIALLLIGIGQLFADFGFSAAIIQAPDLRTRDIDFLFTLQLALGAVLSAAGIALATPIASFFNSPEATDVIGWMSLIFVLRAAGQTSTALLSRDLKFRSVQIGYIGSYLIGYLGVGVPLAFSGAGVWSLVSAQLVQTAAASCFALLQAGRVPRFVMRSDSSGLLRFGSLVIFANISSWILLTVDSMIVGRLAGATSLGLYNRALGLAGTPGGAITSGLQGVLLAASSRAQGRPDNVAKGVLACMGLFILLAGSVLLSLAVSSETVVLGLYGSDWAGAAPMLRPLALAMAVHGILAFIGPALTGLGRVELEVRAQVMTVVAAIPLWILAANHSVIAVAWAVLGVYLIRLALLSFAVQRVLRFERKTLSAALAPAFGVAVWTSAAVGGADHLLSDLSITWRLFAIVLTGAVALLVGVLATRQRLMTSPVGETLLKSGVIPSSILRYLRKGT